MFNESKIVLNAYNNTQNLMIQGRASDSFVSNILEPCFREMIETSQEKIVKFYHDIKDSLQKESLLKNVGSL